MTQPILFQRLEGAILLAVSYWLFSWNGGHWWVFIIGFFVIDLTCLGYLMNPRLGAFIYNLGHSLVVPGLLVLIYIISRDQLPLVLYIWLGHIGIDRMLGYGLKFPDSFGHTHLGSIGKLARGK